MSLLAPLMMLACEGQEKILWRNASEYDFTSRRGITLMEGQPFSGRRFALFPSGDTMKVEVFRGGRLHGFSLSWHENRVLRDVRYFENGKKNGTHKGWFEDGSIRFIAHYIDDQYEGNVKEWGRNGLLYRDFNYRDGHEHGMQRMWESDGRLKANYEARDGRRYGFSGSQNCLSAMR